MIFDLFKKKERVIEDRRVVHLEYLDDVMPIAR